MSSTPEYTRLHITPLNPNLLTTIIPPSILPNAKNISYHTLETFQDKAYGFVDLPTMDAEKLKKKLHGSILKGSKIRIETARPAEDLSPVNEPEEAPKRQRERKDPSKKRKRGEETIPAAVIGDRKVKRGWTTTAADISKTKKQSKELKNVVKSKYTTNEECLFKTVLPPNVAAHTKATSGEKSSRRSKKGRGVIVHEFAKSTKYATFLRSTTGGTKVKTAVEFVDGKGWVDEDGNIVEEVVKKVRKNQEPQKEKPVHKEAMEDQGSGSDSASDQEKSEEDESSSNESNFEERVMKKVKRAAEVESSSSSDSESSADEDEYIKPQSISKDSEKATASDAIEPPIEAKSSSDSESSLEGKEAHANSDQRKVSKARAEAEPKDDASSSGSDTSSDPEPSDSSDEDSEDEGPPSIAASPQNPAAFKPSTMPPPVSTMTPETKSIRPQSSAGLSIKIPSPTPHATPIPTEVHPLEALYKRPKPNSDSTSDEPRPETKSNSFSFFGADDEDSDIGEEPNQLPLTPFSQRDFEYRGVRSAAPTPDTAYVNKRFIWPGGNEDDVGDDGSSPTPKESVGGKIIFKEKESEEVPKSDFQKWFYEHRGENTRGWKKRRKTVAKEQRHRENKKRSHV
ncbi:befa30df-b934-4fde-bf9a-4652093ed0df-CDS [Sclerotinia trifoliorum]|uniref:Befa30df-b934-4fde-bf9a-4652093ed0df-CDS n=1 Tax=Sclerotinia trifoliorum TaxID=28548 RepID=A0A8H2VN69_9HELO|nr:befa30df-b934-4fde-bf9a-4652093ed0df-CDS [Sclerotinia trifoliorum]